MTITAIREGIADNLSLVSDLTAYATVTGQPVPPCAVVIPAQPFGQIESMGRGIFSWHFRVLVLAASSVDEAAQNTLDDFLASSGNGSVLVAIETDRTLGGAASDCRVEEITAYGDVTYNDIPFWGAELQVRVLAEG